MADMVLSQHSHRPLQEQREFRVIYREFLRLVETQMFQKLLEVAVRIQDLRRVRQPRWLPQRAQQCLEEMYRKLMVVRGCRVFLNIAGNPLMGALGLRLLLRGRPLRS